jgi:hypothetical protein
MAQDRSSPHEDLRELAEEADILEDEKRRIQGYLKVHE